MASALPRNPSAPAAGACVPSSSADRPGMLLNVFEYPLRNREVCAVITGIAVEGLVATAALRLAEGRFDAGQVQPGAGR